MDRFRELETFVAVADRGGFNAAARHLNLSPPSVTRMVAALEQRLGTRLFVRTTRNVSLTEAGRRLLDGAARVLSDLDEIESAAAGAQSEPQGTLSVTAPVLFGHRFVAPILREFIDLNPRVTVRTLFVDRVVNLIEEGLDVALRIGELPDSSLRAVRVGSVRRVVVAAPEYLARIDRPDHPRDLAGHRVAQVVESGSNLTWDFVANGNRETVTLRPALLCNTVDATIDAAMAGWGVTRALSYQVAEALESGALVELLPVFENRRLPIHLVYAEGRLSAAKIRDFMTFAAAALTIRAKALEGV